MSAVTSENPSSAQRLRLQYKAFRWGLLASLPLAPFLFCLFFAERIWQALIPLRMTSFVLALIGLVIVLLIGPVFSVVSGMLALHFRIEAGFASPIGKRKLTDKLFLLAGILASLIPALATLLAAFLLRIYQQSLLTLAGSLGLTLFFSVLAGLYWINRLKQEPQERGR